MKVPWYQMTQNAGLHRHYRTSPSSIQSWLGRPNEALFDTILVYQVTGSDECERPWKIIGEHASVEYAVSMEIEEASKGLHFNIVCNTSILPREQAESHVASSMTTAPGSAEPLIF